MKPIGSITLLCALAGSGVRVRFGPTTHGPGVAKPSAAAAGVPSTEGLASPDGSSSRATSSCSPRCRQLHEGHARVRLTSAWRQHERWYARDAIGGKRVRGGATPGNGLGPGGRSQTRSRPAGRSPARRPLCGLYFFDPADAQLFETRSSNRRTRTWAAASRIRSGEAAGRQVARRRSREPGGRLRPAWTGTVPVGSGLWFSSGEAASAT